MIDHPSAEDLKSWLHAQVAASLDIDPAELRFSLLSKPEVADGTTVAAVNDAAGRRRAVVLCSTPAYPDMVERAMSRANEAKTLLGPVIGAPILDPLTTGRVNGLSYTVLPYCDRLTDARPFWWIQRAVLRPALFDWLCQSNKRSVSAVPPGEIDHRFFTPLRHVASESALSEHLRFAAKEAIARLDSGAWTPKHVLMHGDLWKGNILLRREKGTHHWQRWGRRFAVIDWPGSSLQGYAIYDLVRLAQSMRTSSQSVRHELGRHCAVLQCQPVDAKCHLLAALGHIAMTRESFPMAIYVRMAETCLTTIEHALLRDKKELIPCR